MSIRNGINERYIGSNMSANDLLNLLNEINKSNNTRARVLDSILNYVRNLTLLTFFKLVNKKL